MVAGIVLEQGGRDKHHGLLVDLQFRGGDGPASGNVVSSAPLDVVFYRASLRVIGDRIVSTAADGGGGDDVSGAI
ncbi:hypothetical protein [Marinobacter sp. PE14]